MTYCLKASFGQEKKNTQKNLPCKANCGLVLYNDLSQPIGTPHHPLFPSLPPPSVPLSLSLFFLELCRSPVIFRS